MQTNNKKLNTIWNNKETINMTNFLLLLVLWCLSTPLFCFASVILFIKYLVDHTEGGYHQKRF